VTQPAWPKFLQSLEVFTNETEIQLNIVDSTKPVAARFFEWCATFLPTLASGAIEYIAAGHRFRISRGSFFQINRFLLDALVQTVMGQIEGAHAVDLYAGVGLFSLPLATRFQKVDAVERSGSAFHDLEWNAAQSESGIVPLKASAEEFLGGLSSKPDFLVADPPRSGLGRDAARELLRVGSPLVAIVSCDPATLARDLRVLLEQYRIEKITLVDLFPQTYHFETVVHLERRS
jgi:23S rRNA (uracil1939-C5)-methyltransferase